MPRDPAEPPSDAARRAPPAQDGHMTRDMASAVAHDMNNPLTWVYSGIDFALEAISKGDLAQARSDLGQAREGADRLHAVVRRLEAFAATGSVQALRPPVPVALAPVPGATGRGRILVIDDEPSLVELVQQGLSTTHVVVACPSPRAALAMVRSGEWFDAVLCDLAMPELDGLSLYAELLRIAPDLARRCVLMTGGATSARAHALLEAHPGPRLAKPFGMRALREVLSLVMAAPAR